MGSISAANLICRPCQSRNRVKRRVASTAVFGVRFEAMVHKGPRCWEWLGSTVNGYGQFLVIDPAAGRRMVGAHRFAWRATFGTIPAGHRVHHTCGNPACVWPDHLVLGVAGTGGRSARPGEARQDIPAQNGTAASARRTKARTPTWETADAHVHHRGTEQGQGVLEYGLMFALMAVVAVLALVLFGPQVSAIINAFAK